MGVSWHRALGTDVGQAHGGGLDAELGERFVPVPWSVVISCGSWDTMGVVLGEERVVWKEDEQSSEPEVFSFLIGSLFLARSYGHHNYVIWWCHTSVKSRGISIISWR